MARPHVEILHSPDVPSSDLAAGGWPHGVRVRALSEDADNGAFTGLLRLPPGWRRGRGHLACTSELLVLSGSVRIGEDVRGFGWYEWSPAGSTQKPWVADGDAGCELLFAARTGRPDFRAGRGSDPPGRVEIDTERMPWMGSPIPGPPPGVVLKVLRHDPATGEMSALYAGPPRRDYRKLEFHDCVEEIFLIEGDSWLGNSGPMRPGSYFWRPPYITHGPFFSRGGNFSFLYVDSALVNHFTDPRATPEQNRSQAAGEEAPRDYVATTA